MLSVIASVLHQHDPRLVGLAAGICAIACFTTLTMIATTPAETRGGAGTRAPPITLITAGIVFGAGVWSLHFVAMMAYQSNLPMSYGARDTAASLGVAVLGATVAFVVWRRIASAPLASLIGGAVLGGTIDAMHYVGMAAMLPAGSKSFDHAKVAASVAIGIGFAVLALWRGGDLREMRRRAEACVWLAIAICGSHFTGMVALSLHAGAAVPYPHATFANSAALAVMVGAVSMAVLLGGLGAALTDQRLSSRTVLELQRMRRLANLSHEALIIHRNGLVLEVNDAASRLFGVTCEQVAGRRMEDLFAPEHAATLRLGASIPEGAEIMVHTAAALIPAEVSSSEIEFEGKPAIATALRDLTESRAREERIRHLAGHDALTDLPNRSLLGERLSRAIGNAAEDGDGVAVLHLDLDRFKPLNDLLGHAGGDRLLVQVADRLRGELRQHDTLARVGGDEFVVVTPIGLTPHKAIAMANRLIGALHRPFDLGDRQVEIGASIGVALFPTDATDQEALIRAADTALERVKSGARGAFCLYEPEMDNKLQRCRRLEQDLRHAVERGELELHYQPVVNCRTGAIDGFEALLRWRHPERGMIPPIDFIPLAEETLLIGSIGEWVLEAACAAAAAWTRPYWVAVNVSPLQFRQADFVDRLATILDRTGLAASRLEIEVTEGVFVQDAERAKSMMAGIRGLGVRMSLDDFGTGYSSLSYLCSFAFDKIKIDRSFVMVLGQSSQALTLVRTIINLGHSLGLAVTAEGIETADQMQTVAALACDHVQGYLLGRPQPHLPDRHTLPTPTPRRRVAEAA